MYVSTHMHTTTGIFKVIFPAGAGVSHVGPMTIFSTLPYFLHLPLLTPFPAFVLPPPLAKSFSVFPALYFLLHTFPSLFIPSHFHPSSTHDPTISTCFSSQHPSQALFPSSSTIHHLSSSLSTILRTSTGTFTFRPFPAFVAALCSAPMSHSHTSLYFSHM